MDQKPKKFALYAAFALACAVVFLVALFPRDAAREFVETRFAQIAPGLSLSVGEAGLAWPPGLALESPSIYTSSGDRLFSMDSLEVSVSPFSLFSSTPPVKVSAAAYGGRVEAAVARKPGGPDGYNQLDILVTRAMDASRMDAVARLSGREITGSVTGRLTLTGPLADPLSGRGSGNLTLKNGSVAVDNPMLALKALNVETLSVDLELAGRTVKITRAELSGLHAQATAQGLLYPRSPLAGSRVDIQGTVAPTQELFKELGADSPLGMALGGRSSSPRIRFRISGTLADPRLELL
ncbi:MAG: type II secretion system protein GspN [Deltaproteobacteria bacterium]|nr:type II secretion system protein GspN [Deltaproteobacteria bacterium]